MMPGTCARCGKPVTLRLPTRERIVPADRRMLPTTITRPIAWVNPDGSRHSHRRAA